MKNIRVLGPGCAKCKKLFDNVEKAVRELGIECEVEKITDIGEITRYDVMMTPGLVVDGVVKSSGSALSVDKIKKILTEE
jgi:small redox-active disulfide protein 2